MPQDVELFRHKSVTGIINAFKTPQELKLKASGILPERGVQGQFIQWDIRGISRDIGKFQGKHSPAGVRSIQTLGRQTAKLARTFQVVPVQGSENLDLNRPGSLEREKLAEDQAGQAELELRTLIDRQDEYMIAKALQGSLTMTIDDVAQTVDYGIPADNQLSVGDGIPVSWNDPAADIIKDLEDMALLIQEGSGYTASTVWCTRATLRRLVTNDKVSEYFASTPAGVEALTRGSIGQFQGLNWVAYDGGYIDGAGVFQPFIPKNRIIVTPMPDRNWGEMVVGTDAIPGDDNDQSMVEVQGLYSYVRGSHNPAALNFFAGKVRLPVLPTPGAIVIADVA